MADDNKDKGEKLKKGSDDDCSSGPVTKRGITDCPCCLLFIAHWVAFIALAGMAIAGGNVSKLTAGRDWQGNYCGTDGNWNTGADLGNHPVAFYGMNTSAVMDQVATQVVCQAAGLGVSQITDLFDANNFDQTARDKVCGASTDPSEAAQAAAAKYASYFSDPSKATELFKSGGGSSFIAELTKYFMPTCITTCDIDTSARSTAYSEGRTFVYTPSGDVVWKQAWDVMWEDPTLNGISAFQSFKDTVFASFTFDALDKAICPYDDTRYCVPFPGVTFTEVQGYCIMKLNDAAAAAFADAGAAAANALAESAAAQAVSSAFGDMMGDIMTSIDTLIIVCVLAFVIGMGFMLILRYTVGIIIWSSVLIVLVLLIAGGAYAFLQATSCEGESAFATFTDLVNETISNVTLETCNAEGAPYVVEDAGMRDMYTYGAYAFFALAGIYFIIVLCMCNRIKLAIAINKVAAIFVMQTKPAVFIPAVQVLVAAVWLIVWALIAMLILTQVPDNYVPSGPFTELEANGDKNTVGQCNSFWPAGAGYKDESIEACTTDATVLEALVANNTIADAAARCYTCMPPRYAMDERFAFAFFSMLWNNAFIIAVGQCTIAGAAGVWYFTPNDEKGTKPAVRTGLRNCFRYHLGSLAFGSFILAVVQFIKWYMYYLQKQAEQAKNPVAVRIFKILQYIIWCFEKCIKFLNKNAYIQIALLGKNFCRSAWNAFMLIVRNAARIAVLGSVGAIIGRLGVGFITIATTVIGYFLLVAMHTDDINSPIVPTVLYFIMGYLAARLTMNVYSLAIDTILQCVVADEEINDAESQYTPELLKPHLSKGENKGKCCAIL